MVSYLITWCILGRSKSKYWNVVPDFTGSITVFPVHRVHSGSENGWLGFEF